MSELKYFSQRELLQIKDGSSDLKYVLGIKEETSQKWHRFDANINCSSCDICLTASAFRLCFFSLSFHHLFSGERSFNFWDGTEIIVSFFVRAAASEPWALQVRHLESHSMLLAFLMAAFSGILSEIASDSHVGRVETDRCSGFKEMWPSLWKQREHRRCQCGFRWRWSPHQDITENYLLHGWRYNLDLTVPPVCVVFVLICELVGSSVNQPTASLCHSCWLSLRAQTYEHSR